MILDPAILWLLSTFRGATSWPVFDGPVPTSINHQQFVLVGSTGEEEDGATIDRPESNLGPGGWREEVGDIVCSAWSYSGGTDIATRRANAMSTTAALIAAVEADPSMGGLLTAPRRAEVLDVRYQPRQTDTGAIVRIIFSVTYRSLDL